MNSADSRAAAGLQGAPRYQRAPRDRSREPTAYELMDGIEAAQDLIVNVQGDTLTADRVQAAVADGIRLAVSDPVTWGSALAAMQVQAQTKAGNWVLGLVWGTLKRGLLFAVAGLVVYSVGGWTALAAFVKSFGSHP